MPSDFEKGVRDGENGVYDRTVPNRTFTIHSDEELEQIDEYNRGIDQGRRNSEDK